MYVYRYDTFWRSIYLSFQSHQMCTFSEGLGMVWNRADGISCNKIFTEVKKGQTHMNTHTHLRMNQSWLLGLI